MKGLPRIPGWYAAGGWQEGLAGAAQGSFPGHLTWKRISLRLGGTYLFRGPWKCPEGRRACKEPPDGWVSSSPFPALGGDSPEERTQGRGQDTHLVTHPPTYLQPRAGTQTLTCGGWQAGGHSGPGVPQG